MLVNLNQILPKARREKYAVGAFNINNLESAQAIIEAADETNSPVIIQTSEGAIDYAGMDYLGVIAQVAANSTRSPVAFHLDHGKNYDLVIQAIDSGFYTSVMFDGSSLSYDENIKITKDIVKRAHKKNITVEAELGKIFGAEDNVSVSKKEIEYTDPIQAKEFVLKTGCDALAISIGTAHGANKFSGSPKLDFKRLSEIKKQVKIPLVLHGASSVPKSLIALLRKKCEQVGDCERLQNAIGVPLSAEKKAIQLGISKINVDTDLRIAFTAAVREVIIEDSTVFDPRKILGPARELMSAIIKDKMKHFGCVQKA